MQKGTLGCYSLEYEEHCIWHLLGWSHQKHQGGWNPKTTLGLGNTVEESRGWKHLPHSLGNSRQVKGLPMSECWARGPFSCLTCIS